VCGETPVRLSCVMRLAVLPGIPWEYTRWFARLGVVTQTVKIDEIAYAGLRELADRDHLTLQEALAKAVDVARRERFFQDLDRGYAEMTTEEWAEENAEREHWDQTLPSTSGAIRCDRV
jgi:hypothetical protein